MITLTVGELFAGYGGLGLGLNLLTDTRTAWVSDIAPGPRKLLAHRFPDAPNLGDVTTVDWTTVEPVDVITGGSPCQDMSVAGKRAGMIDGTRSGLWSYQADAVAALRPKAVVWENVRGARTAKAAMPDGTTGTALQRVTGDLEALGYEVRSTIVKASDVGAPHQRARVFLLATQPGFTLPTVTDGYPALELANQLLSTPTASESTGPGDHGTGAPNLRTVVSLLPTPVVNDMGAAYTPETWDAWTERMRARHGNGNGHGKSLNIEVQRLLPTPRATEGTKGGPNQRGSKGDLTLSSAVHDFGPYQAAIARWEQTIGRPAPAPTEPGRHGNPRLSAEFAEWMMGLPAGWVTAVPGVTRSEALKLAGNGVVPQQAAYALSDLASRVDLLDLLAVAL